MAGFMKAVNQGLVSKEERGVLDATAHALKFSPFQEMYFSNGFPPEFEVKPNKEFRNTPLSIEPAGLDKLPEPGKPLQGKDLERFIEASAAKIASILDLKKR